MRSLVCGSSIAGGSQWRSSLCETPSPVPPACPPWALKRSKLARKGRYERAKPTNGLSLTQPVHQPARCSTLVNVRAGSAIGAQPGSPTMPRYGRQPLNGNTRRPVMIERLAGTVGMASG
jgi:hypothetical protein